jgi:hypothetical protein
MRKAARRNALSPQLKQEFQAHKVETIELREAVSVKPLENTTTQSAWITTEYEAGINQLPLCLYKPNNT